MHHDMNGNDDSGYLESTVSSLRDQVKQEQHRHKGDGELPSNANTPDSLLSHIPEWACGSEEGSGNEQRLSLMVL